MKVRKEKSVQPVRAVRRGWGITGKLAAAVVGSVIIAVAILLAVVYIKMSRALLEKSEDLLRTTMDMTLQEATAWMDQTLSMLETQRDAIEFSDMDVFTMMDYIKHTTGKNDSYPAGMYVALTTGALYHASFVPGPDYDPRLKGWYQDGLESDGFILGDVYMDEASQSYVVGASGLLKTQTGAVRGVAAADLYLDAISNIVRDVRIEETGGIFLVDTRTDIIIGHPDKTMIGQKLGSASGSMYTYATGQIKSGARGMSIYDNTYIQVEDVPGCDWTAVAYVSRSEVLGELLELTATIALLALVAVAAVILLVIIQVRRIIGVPVQELDQAALRIADGELDQSIQYQSNDELGALADSFNRVTLRLRDYVRSRPPPGMLRWARSRFPPAR